MTRQNPVILRRPVGILELAALLAETLGEDGAYPADRLKSSPITADARRLLHTILATAPDAVERGEKMLAEEKPLTPDMLHEKIHYLRTLRNRTASRFAHGFHEALDQIERRFR